jgi:hypothetical protein
VRASNVHGELFVRWSLAVCLVGERSEPERVRLIFDCLDGVSEWVDAVS